MHSAISKLKSANWELIRSHIDAKGYGLVKSVLDRDECLRLIEMYNDSGQFRKTVNMERYRFGRGEYKYFTYPLPDLIQTVRRDSYSYLAPLANQWMQNLGIESRYPVDHDPFIRQCHEKGQQKATVLILKYGVGGFNTLHQDLYGEVYFPFQIVLCLNEPGKDFDGGEFVLTEQIPRAQSKATVLSPDLGDMVIFTTNFRPIAGSRGYYRANIKHGVSEVLRGQRHTLGIIFHDASS